MFAAIGKSRIDEKKLYGPSNTYTGVTTGVTAGITYSGYTIDNLYYQDYDDGITTITGSTTNFSTAGLVNGDAVTSVTLTPDANGAKAYCLGHDWFDEDNPCPYPVYRVSDGSLVERED